MKFHRSGALAPVLLFLVLAGCAPAAIQVTPPGSGTATTTSDEAPASLAGEYSVEYRTTESDHDPISNETIVRNGKVTGFCSASDCALDFTIEVKAADGSIGSDTTALTFDGAAYLGSQTTPFTCDGIRTLTTVENGLEYTSETTINPSATTAIDGRNVVTKFDITTVERNEITAAGRNAGCLRINLTGPDPFVSNATIVGVGTRKP